MAEFVFNTTAFINSWNFHYRLPVFAGVWNAIGEAMLDGIVVAPSEVMTELEVRAGDSLHQWVKQFDGAFIPPEVSWSPHMETVRGHAPHWFAGTGEHDADPFVVPMAMEHGLPVVTYEGVAFSGDAARVRAQRRGMPHVCALVHVPVLLMVDVLDHLGVVI